MGYLSNPVLQYKTEYWRVGVLPWGRTHRIRCFGHCFIQRESIRVDPENKISF